MSHADTGSVIDGDTAALTVDREGGFALLLPDFEREENVPDPVIFLTAIMLRVSSDPEFYAEQVEWFKNLDPQ